MRKRGQGASQRSRPKVKSGDGGQGESQTSGPKVISGEEVKEKARGQGQRSNQGMEEEVRRQDQRIAKDAQEVLIVQGSAGTGSIFHSFLP